MDPAVPGDHDATYDPYRAEGRIDYSTPGHSGLARDYYLHPLGPYTFGNKTWDYNTDGFAHVGLYPDFVADLQAIGLTHDDLAPLFNSAEAYVRMWEKVDDDEAPTVVCGTVGEDWHADDVTVPCIAYDFGWGLATSAPAAFTLATNVPNDTETDNASTGTHAAICDQIGQCTSTIPAIAGINVDKKAPTVTVTTPPAGSPTYLLNQIVTADYTCSDDGSGIAACAGPVPNSAALDTAIGLHAFSVSGSDNVGHSVSVSHPYQVTYGICPLYDATRSGQAGRTIPLKVQICGSNAVNVSTPSITLTAVALDGNPPPPSFAGNANPEYVFRYDATLQGYVYNLKTTGLAPGNHTVSFSVSGDPAGHTIAFRLE